MAKAWWLLAAVSFGCSDPDGADEEPRPAASLTLTLSEPDGTPACAAAAPSPYLLGSEENPLTDGARGAEVSCSIHETDGDSWFTGSVAGTEANGGGQLRLVISSENGLAVTVVSDLTGTLARDPASTDSCAPLFTATIGDAISADFDCPLLSDPSDATKGCGARGTVTFENCEL